MNLKERIKLKLKRRLQFPYDDLELERLANVVLGRYQSNKYKLHSWFVWENRVECYEKSKR